jgi:hypothetical protein
MPTPKFIIVNEIEGTICEALSKAGAEECIAETIQEIAFGGHDDAESNVSVYEVKKEWDYEITTRLKERKEK